MQLNTLYCCQKGGINRSQVFINWCNENQIKINYIQPGKPVQNAYVERFIRLYREDVLDAYLFSDMGQVKIISENWMEDYNGNLPHGSLGGKSPRQHARINIPDFYDNNILEELSKTSMFGQG